MRNLVLLGASALILAIGVGGVSAQPTTSHLLAAGQGYSVNSSSVTLNEGRAAAFDTPITAAAALASQRHIGR